MKLKITYSSLAIISALLLFLIVIELFFLNEKKQFELLNSKNNLALERCVSKIINAEINNMIVSLKTFDFIFKSKGYNKTSFEPLARKIIAENTSISELQFAPMGKIKDTYPRDPQFSAIGHDLNVLKKRKKGVLLSIENKKITLIGPVKLIQNSRLAFILRLPIFDDELNFSGFIIAVSYIENIRDKLLLDDFNYKIEGFNPDGEMLTIFDNIKDKNLKIINVFKVAIPNGEWRFSIQSSKLESDKYTLVRVFLYLFVVMFSFYIYRRECDLKLKHDLIVDTNNQLRQVSLTDELTTIPNRRYMNDRLKEIFKFNLRHTHSIAFLDLDHFKMVNDTYGHDAGDEVLKLFADICLTNVRSDDVIARWGGEEFMLLMKNTNKTNAEDVCSRILLSVARSPFLFKDHVIQVTVSMGLTSFSPQNSQLDEIIKRVDDALYMSKKSGRNKITVL